ncbi:MAG: transglycosylase SLT domain-containing protein [Vulcanimicrobiota bacterium]
MSTPKVNNHQTTQARPVQPKKTETPAPKEAPKAAPEEKVSLTNTQGEKKEPGLSKHVDALKGNFGPESEEARAADQGEKAKESDPPKTPEQQKTDLNQQIQDLQQQIEAEKDPEKKKALEEQLAKLQADLTKVDGGDQAQDGQNAGEAGGAEGGAPVAGGDNNPAARTPWRREQQDWGGPQGAGGPQGGGGPQEAGPASGPAPTTQPSGNVREWVAQAMQILQQDGVDMSKVREQDIYLMIQKESGGNPNAQNNWDSNAKAGHPSKGIMQCIDSTFNQYKSPGHDDIWNPVHNIVAAVKYAVARYGSTSNVPGVKSMSQGGAYRGY